jgi:hypothetical protein
MVQYLALASIVLVIVYAAHKRRGKCRWSEQQVHHKTILSIAGIVFALAAEIVLRPVPTSPVDIAINFLFLYSIYSTAKALYRGADLRPKTGPSTGGN